jgi:hypothetical protein
MQHAKKMRKIHFYRNSSIDTNLRLENLRTLRNVAHFIEKNAYGATNDVHIRACRKLARITNFPFERQF